MLGAMVAVMAGNNNVPVQNEAGTEGDLNLNDWPEPVDMDQDSDQGAGNDFGGRRLMSVPENLDEELSMEFDSDKEKNQGGNEDVSEMKCNSDASMSSKDS